MGVPFNPCFFLLLFPLIMLLLYFAHGEDEFLPSNCMKGFFCAPNMGYLEFPFAPHTHPHCGLILVDCDAKPHPNIQLETGGDWYQLLSNDLLGSNTIFLEDWKLEGLVESGNYSNLTYTLQFHNPQSIIFRNVEASPFLECNQSPADDIDNYERHNCAEGFSFSLKYKSELVPENPKCDPANCTLYPSPIIVQQTNALLTAQFGLYLQLSPLCYDCYHGGGICRADSNYEFQCANDELPSNCTEEFLCGSMGYLKFPFAPHTQPHCGLIAVDCDAKPLPNIQLGTRGDSYQLQLVKPSPVWGGYVIFLGDVKLQSLLNLTCPNYSNLNYTLQFPYSPSINFHNVEAKKLNLPFLKCNYIQADDDMGNYERYNCTREFNFTLNYKHPLSPENPKCEAAKYTLDPTPILVKQRNSVLTSQFGLEFHVSPACYDCYYNQGGQCTTDSKNKFHCKKGKSKKRLILITVLSGGLGLILVSLAVFFVWGQKKGSKRSSRNTSLGLPSDLERGRSRLFGILVFSYSELEEATNNFDPSKELGDGGFGTVYYGMLKDGREVAVKRLHERNCKRMEQFMNEISILTRLKHPNLVTLYGCTSRHNRELLLVYEYIQNGTLEDHLHGQRAADGLLTWPIRMKIAVETAAALVYLHASEVIHRDVKSSNILLDENFCVKVADFGLSKLFPANVTHATTTPKGTPGYVDPDYHECYQLTYKSDVYSFGVVLIELLSSMPAVDVRRHTHEISLAKLARNKILIGAFHELIDSSLGYEMDTEIKRMTTSVAELAFQCLQTDKDMRPTMEQVLESLKEIRGDELSNEDEGVNSEETNASTEEEPQRKAVTWAGPSLAPRGILKLVSTRKSS